MRLVITTDSLLDMAVHKVNQVTRSVRPSNPRITLRIMRMLVALVLTHQPFSHRCNSSTSKGHLSFHSMVLDQHLGWLLESKWRSHNHQEARLLLASL
jgi:hypothetical protein